MNIPSLTATCERLVPETREFLKRLVAVNSFTANGQGVNRNGELIAAAFQALGFQAEFVAAHKPGYGNHLILKRSRVEGAPTIALISHLDTVFSADEETRNHFVWREEGSRIYGPGTNDIKGGTAAIYMLVHALRVESTALFEAVNWVLLFNACEETDSSDFGALCRAQLPADTLACLIFEADGADRASGGAFSLVSARKGRATFVIEVEGHGAHAGGDHARGANAVVQLADVITRVAALTDYSAGLNVNVGPIEGGLVLNRVPHRASVALEMRAFSSEVYERGKQQILALSGEGTVRSFEGPPRACKINSRLLEETVPWPRNAATDRLIAVWQEAGREAGVDVTSTVRGGLSDGNVIWNTFPTLDGLGPCGDQSHCSEHDPANGKEQEWVDMASFVPKTALNALAVARLLKS